MPSPVARPGSVGVMAHPHSQFDQVLVSLQHSSVSSWLVVREHTEAPLSASLLFRVVPGVFKLPAEPGCLGTLEGG